MKNIHEKIKDYIEYLKSVGYFVSFHIKGAEDCDRLLPYALHSNPYCLKVKAKKEAWDRCIACQKKIREKKENEPFFGMCYAGVCEYVFPVGSCGWVSVSGYRSNEKKAVKRISRISQSFGFDRELLKKAYFENLRSDIPPKKRAEALIYPLCVMLELAFPESVDRQEEKSDTNADYIYAHAVFYIKNNYREKITVDDLCRYCHCSRSYLSHIFKKRSGVSISAYANKIRLEKALKMLENSSLSMSEIAQKTGFSDSNYFTRLFNERYGASPTKYCIKK